MVGAQGIAAWWVGSPQRPQIWRVWLSWGLGGSLAGWRGEAAVPAVSLPPSGTPVAPSRVVPRQGGIPAHLMRLDKYLAQGLIAQDENAAQRARILAEL